MKCITRTALTITSTNTGFTKYTNAAGVSSMSLDITNYFDTPTGVCTYTQCSVVDSSGYSISWLTGGSLSGNICSFNIITSVQ